MASFKRNDRQTKIQLTLIWDMGEEAQCVCAYLGMKLGRVVVVFGWKVKVTKLHVAYWWQFCSVLVLGFLRISSYNNVIVGITK